MAAYGQSSIFLLAAGYPVTGYIMDGAFHKEALTEQSDTWGDSWVENSGVGMTRANLSIGNGFYDDASGASDEIMQALKGVSAVCILGLAGNVIGRGFVGMSGMINNTFTRTASRGALHKFSGEFVNSGLVEEGQIVHALGAESGDDTAEGTPVDGGASSSDGGSGYLEVTALALGGYDDITVRIIDSSDDITYAELVSFTAVTAVGAERVTVSGTVERYVSADWSWTGSGSSESATFLAGFYRA